MKEAMLLKRRYITNSPTLQIYLHKMLHLCSDSSITGFQWRNVEATTLNMCPHKSWLWATVWVLSGLKQHNIASIIITPPIAHITKIARPNNPSKVFIKSMSDSIKVNK
jgi:hypothetical protein